MRREKCFAAFSSTTAIGRSIIILRTHHSSALSDRIGANLPAKSPARWFRWAAKCPGAIQQPPDANPQNGFTDGWVYSPVARACYWSVWGVGQPAGELTKPEWRAELTNIFSYWVTEMGLSGFMLDDPSAYLAAHNQADNQKNDLLVSRYVRDVIVEPMHQLGAAVWGEMYDFQRATTAKMLDAGRNTDMPDGTPGALKSPQIRILVVEKENVQACSPSRLGCIVG